MAKRISVETGTLQRLRSEKDRQRLGRRACGKGEEEDGEQQVAARGQHFHHRQGLKAAATGTRRQGETVNPLDSTGPAATGGSIRGERLPKGSGRSDSNDDYQRQPEVPAVPVDLDEAGR